MTSLSARLDQVSAALTQLTRPLGIIALIMIFLSIILTPVLPDWARENRGLLVKVLLAVAAVAWAPDIITFVMGG